MTQDVMTQQEISQPPSPIRNGNYEAMEEDNDDYEGDESEGDPNDNEVGDLDVYCAQEEMDHDIPYNRCYAIGNDGNNRLLPLAFALVTAENNDNWEWFMRLVRTKVIPANREVCVLSDRNQGILNAVQIDIPGHAPLHHRWCMRHFVSNFYRACGNKELSDDLKDCCLAYTDARFATLYNKLVAQKNLTPGGFEFLNRHLELRVKWAEPMMKVVGGMAR
jgi:hypothetical protein